MTHHRRVAADVRLWGLHPRHPAAVPVFGFQAFAFEVHGRLALPFLRPFPASPVLRPLLTSRSAFRRRPFRREARPPQVRPVAFTARRPGLRRPRLVTKASRLRARLAQRTAPHTRFLFVRSRLRYRFFRRRPRGRSSCESLWGTHDQAPTGTYTPATGHAGHTRGARCPP